MVGVPARGLLPEAHRKVSARKILATPVNPTFERTDRDLKRIQKSKHFLITSAQNNTEVNHGFLRALEHWVAERKGELLIQPMRYKNPTSRKDPQEERSADYWWAPEVAPYLVENDILLNDHLAFMAGMRIQATSSRPLGQLDSRSKGRSAIYGHSQLAMRTVATPQQRLPKLLYTTGAVTKKNYSSTKAGNLAAFHHSPSAIAVEIRGSRFHAREVTWDGEGFTDYDRRYTAAGAEDAPPVLALVTGDEHVWFHDPDVRKATYDAKDSVVATLRPPMIVRHDLFDCYSVSPHHFQRRITRAVKTREGWGSLRRELDDTLRFMEATTPEGVKNVIVNANHHDQLFRWLQSGEKYVEPENLELYYWMNWQMLAGARMTPNGVKHPDPFELYAREYATLVDVLWLGPDDSLVVGSVELGMHGHMGPNGARGTVQNLSRIGLRSIVGHSHSPGIFEGAYQVGTSSRLRLEYNSGPSSWLNTHAVVHANHRRQMIHIIDGHWRG